MTQKNIFTFAETKIEPGTKTSILFPAPHINTQIKMNIPVHVFHGKKPGPKLFIMGTLHGDELNGIEIIRRIHQQLHVSHLHGTVITVPVANVYGLITQSRYLPDGRDLNRSFPGAEKGTMATRLANGLLKIVAQCDYGIDFHTGARGRVNIPQLRVNLKTPGVKQLAMAFGTPVILDAKMRDGSMRQSASDLGIPILVYEGGEAMRYNELCIRAGVHGAMNVMSYLGMIEAPNKPKKKGKPMIAWGSRWVRATASGFIQPIKDVIARSVKKGDALAYIHDPLLLNKSIKLIAPFDGLVIGQTLKPIASEGDALYHIASFKKLAGLSAIIEEYQDDIS